MSVFTMGIIKNVKVLLHCERESEFFPLSLSLLNVNFKLDSL